MSGIATGDINGDGLTDIVATRYAPGASWSAGFDVLFRSSVATTASLSASPNSPVYGQSVTLTAIVTSSTASGLPTGTVTFDDGTTAIGTVPISGGQAIITPPLTVGSHSLSAVYSGDASFAGTTSPVLTLSIAPAPLTITANSATKILNAPNPSFTATYSGFVNEDTSSSLTGTLSCTSTAGKTSPVGSYPITCSGLSSSNYSVSYPSGTLRVFYAPVGTACLGDLNHTILQPINADGTSVWNRGRTIPVKFRVCDANGVSIGTAGVVSSFYLTQIIAGTVTNVDEIVDSTTPDNAFRWDSTQWIFNMSTKSLPANQTYVYTITLNDSTTIQFQFGLK